MPYITTEQVAAIRAELKKTFPKAKFSIRRRDGMAVNIDILKANFTFHKENEQVNHFHYERMYASNAQLVKFLQKLYAAMQKACPNYTVSEDGDYGSIPKYYHNVTIGAWDKPYQKAA